jgi:hypothetical protein
MTSYLNFDRWQSTAGQQYSNVIQTQWTSWTTNTATSAVQAYVSLAAAGGTITITSKLANSKFLLMGQVCGYRSAQNGVNIGFQRTVGGTTTRLLGVDGSGGESWMAEGNGGGSNSFNVTRHWLDSPGQPAGTSIVYTVLGGSWATGGGTAYFNYPSYTLTSMFTIMEIQP